MTETFSHFNIQQQGTSQSIGKLLMVIDSSRITFRYK